MRAQQAIAFSNIAATTAAFECTGGTYVLSVKATGFGTVKLTALLPDGVTYGDVANGSLTADGMTAGLSLPPGQYKVNIASATAVYATLVRVPEE